MLRSLKSLHGCVIQATDGPIGRAVDFFFDDDQWVVRYLVADTGGWLPGRQVLISPESFRRPDWTSRTFPVALTRQQVEESPGVGAHQPVSRQKEMELVEYYGWSPYWTAGAPVIPAFGLGGAAPMKTRAKEEERNDPHLRSAGEVKGYAVHARDGEIGHVEDFIVNDAGWRIKYVVAATQNWIPGRQVLLAPVWIPEVNWDRAEISAGLTREEIRRSPPYRPSEPVNEEYEKRFYDYYGRPRA